jgi:predicted ribosomally synthesized peptide with nif11-like leader
MAKNKDEKIKSQFDAIFCKYQGENLSDDERDSMLVEICRLAENHGFHFTPEDLEELQNNAEEKLSDEELSGVTGGRGQFTRGYTLKFSWWPELETCSCEYAINDSAFMRYYGQGDNQCPDYEWVGYGPVTHQCISCSHLECSHIFKP